MRKLAALAGIMSLIIAAGCSSSGGTKSDKQSGQGGTTSMTAALIPNSDTAPIQLGVTKGIFSKQGIDLKLNTPQAGAATISGVVSGDFQVAYTGVLNYMQARANGIKLHVLTGAGWSTKTPDAQSNGALLVRKSSNIHSLTDLAGKKIGVNALKGVLQLAVGNRLIQAGVDPSKVTFVAIPIAGMLNAVKNGTVDALAINDPFRTMGLDAGDRALSDIFSGFQFPLMTSIYVTSQAQYDKNPQRFAALVKGINESLDYAQSHQPEVRNTMIDYAKMDPKIAQRVILPYWTPKIDMNGVREQADLAHKLGFLADTSDVDKWFQGS